MTQKKKIWTASLLMTLSILLLVLLQAYWLRNAFRDEYRRLKRDAAINLRVAVMQEQVKGFAGMKEEFELPPAPEDSFKRKKSLKRSVINDSPGTNINIIVSEDSIRIAGTPKVIAYEQDRGMDEGENTGLLVVDFPVAIGIINLDTLSRNYKNALKEAGIDLDFILKKVKEDSARHKQRDAGNLRILRRERLPGGRVEMFHDNMEMVQATFENPSWYLVKKIQWQLFFAFIMVSVTSASFIFLYRNLLRQQRLAEMKSDLVSNITHELKTPIATVSVAIEALKSFDVLKDASKTKTYLDISANELKRLNLLVDRVLKLSLFEQDQVNLHFENLDVQDLVNEVLNSLKLQFEKNSAGVNYHVKGSGFFVNGDKMHLTGVLYNLLDNALKYSNSPASVDIILEKTNEKICILVSDKGIGIPPEYRNKIFEKFFRVPHGDMHNIKGYGLGLSYVNEVISRHGGTIEVRARQEAGTEFMILLPMAKEPAS